VESFFGDTYVNHNCGDIADLPSSLYTVASVVSSNYMFSLFITLPYMPFGFGCLHVVFYPT